MPEIETTKEHFELFKTEFLKWQTLFELHEWNVSFHQEEYLDATAGLRCSHRNRKATAILMGHFNAYDTDNIDKLIKSAAQHEALELLVADVRDKAGQRYILLDDIDKSIHILIRKLQFILKDM
jgi:hypothetical protein